MRIEHRNDRILVGALMLGVVAASVLLSRGLGAAADEPDVAREEACEASRYVVGTNPPD